MQTPCDEWKINALLCITIFSFAASPHIHAFFFAFIYPSVASATPLHLPFEIPFSPSCILLLPFPLLSCAPPRQPIPLSIPPIFPSFHSSISLSTLMRSRMTMNTPIIMRKQQAFLPPMCPPLPDLGPQINR